MAYLGSGAYCMGGNDSRHHCGSDGRGDADYDVAQYQVFAAVDTIETGIGFFGKAFAGKDMAEHTGGNQAVAADKDLT